MTLIKNPLEKRIAAARRGQIGDINWAAHIIETVCTMYLEDYINTYVPDLPYEEMEKLLECLGLDPAVIGCIMFGEVCQMIEEKWSEAPEGELPDKSILEAAACLVPGRWRCLQDE